MHALRDSIVKAHGGQQMSREEIHAEMEKVFAKMNRSKKNTTKQLPTIATRKRTTTTFGITQTFPEYEKSEYVPSHQSSFNRIWVFGAAGKIEPVYVHTGLNDGKFTEISSPTLKVGDQILIGLNSETETPTTNQARSPLSPTQGPRMGGGGMR
jgi:hypothetical protein